MVGNRNENKSQDEEPEKYRQSVASWAPVRF
jgi:hypothetical protein